MSKIRASAVSRYLASHEWRRSEWIPSAQVRGWGHHTTGFRCEDSYDFNHRPAVRVSWVPGEGYRGTARDDLDAIVKAKVRAMAETLAEKYDVATETPDSTFGGDPYLWVTAREESGNDDTEAA